MAGDLGDLPEVGLLRAEGLRPGEGLSVGALVHGSEAVGEGEGQVVILHAG